MSNSQRHSDWLRYRIIITSSQRNLIGQGKPPSIGRNFQFTLGFALHRCQKTSKLFFYYVEDPHDANNPRQCRDPSTPRYRHYSPDFARDGYHSRSSTHSHVSRYRSRSQHRSRSRHSDGSRHRDSSPPYDRPRHDAVTKDGRWTFPLPLDVFQKKVLNLLVEIRDLHKKAQPESSAVHIERMESMENFDREDQRLCDAKAFDALVLQIARIGGKNVKDCVHKVLDRLFTNALMANFNMMGKGKKNKRPLERTNIYRAIQGGIMKWDKTATEAFIRTCTSEHLKHAPQRFGGGHTAMP